MKIEHEKLELLKILLAQRYPSVFSSADEIQLAQKDDEQLFIVFKESREATAMAFQTLLYAEYGECPCLFELSDNSENFYQIALPQALTHEADIHTAAGVGFPAELNAQNSNPSVADEKTALAPKTKPIPVPISSSYTNPYAFYSLPPLEPTLGERIISCCRNLCGRR